MLDNLTAKDLANCRTWIVEGLKSCPTSQLRNESLITLAKLNQQLGGYND